MSGHSKWSNIKHRKESVDKKKGKVFSKIARLLAVAAREKGGDPETNPKLRLVIEKAREVNMSKDNIERAVKKGAGQIAGEQIEEVTYEAYGPAGIALIIETITDNKNRTVSELKHVLSKFDGKIAEVGSVKYLFDKQGDGWVAKYPLEISDQKTRDRLENLFETLDDQDDVQEIYSNLK